MQGFTPRHRLLPNDVRYPASLRSFDEAPATLTSSAPLSFDTKRIAIVGSREPVAGAVPWVRDFSRRLAARGVTIVSGGARGVDQAAHEGALDANGATWLILTHGAGQPFDPKAKHDALCARILASKGGRLISPFRDDIAKDRETPLARNRTLVGIVHVVLVVQAHLTSGSRNAITWAHQGGRPLFIVPAPPWQQSFAGSMEALSKHRGRPLLEEGEIFAELGLEAPRMTSAVKKSSRPRKAPQLALLETQEKYIVSMLSGTPQHVDRIASQTGLPIPPLLTALLTLLAKNVVVEGPDGFFRLEN